MNARSLALLLGLSLVGAPASEAQRPGGSRGGAPPPDRGRHAAPRQPNRPPTVAEARHPRAGTGTGYWQQGRYGHRPPYYSGGYYRPYYGPYRYGYRSPYYYGYAGAYGYWGWGAGYAWPYGGAAIGYYAAPSYEGAIRVIAQPVQARVFVNGDYVGVVDDFDGVFQRLRLPPGRYELRLELEGYQTQRFRIAVRSDQTVKIHHTMAPGTGEEQVEDLPGYAEAPLAQRPTGTKQAQPTTAPDEGPPPAWVSTAKPRGGALWLDVTPGDAAVYVDGAFRGTARDLGALGLAAGRHRIEVVRPGHRTHSEEVEVGDGESREIQVRLEPAGSI